MTAKEIKKAILDGATKQDLAEAGASQYQIKKYWVNKTPVSNGDDWSDFIATGVELGFGVEKELNQLTSSEVGECFFLIQQDQGRMQRVVLFMGTETADGIAPKKLLKATSGKNVVATWAKTFSFCRKVHCEELQCVVYAVDQETHQGKLRLYAREPQPTMGGTYETMEVVGITDKTGSNITF